MKFNLVFTNADHDEYRVPIRVNDTDIGKRWFSVLVEQAKIDPDIREKDRLYGFPSDTWTEERIVDELNACIDVLNKDEIHITHRASVGMDQNQLNHLHHYFEKLRGGILTPGAFWQTATPEQQVVLERYNVIIHRAEYFYNTAVRDADTPQPRIVCTFVEHYPRVRLEDADYDLCTFDKRAGEVYINYCEVGKPIYDIYKDGDDVAGDDNIMPLHYYSPTFSVSLFDTRPNWHVDVMDALNEWWDDNDQYLADLGFIKGDPKNALGLIPVGMIDGDVDAIIDALSTFDSVDRVELIDDMGS